MGVLKLHNREGHKKDLHRGLIAQAVWFQGRGRGRSQRPPESEKPPLSLAGSAEHYQQNRDNKGSATKKFSGI